MRSISMPYGVCLPNRWFAMAAGVLYLLAAAGCAVEEVEGADRGEVEQWRFAIEETVGSVQDAYAQRFAELIDEKSGGTVNVTVYPYGTLGTSDQVTELLRMGTLEFAMASAGHIGTLIPEVQVFLLHFVFSDDEQVNNRALADPALRRSFDRLYEEKGFRLLSIFSEGWMVWTTRQPVRTMEDLRNLRIRVMTSPLLLAAYEAYGANPTPLPYGEVYSALQLRMIDAQVNPVFAIQEMSFYEVSDYMIFPNHLPFIATAVTNRDFYESLPPERQRWIDESIEELQTYVYEMQSRYNAERMDIILENKPSLEVIESLTDAQRERLREASLPVRERFVEMVGDGGREVLDQLLDAVARAEDNDE